MMVTFMESCGTVFLLLFLLCLSLFKVLQMKPGVLNMILLLHFAAVLLFWDRVLLRSPGWTGTLYVDNAGLKLPEIHLLLPPNAGIKRHVYHTQNFHICFYAQLGIHMIGMALCWLSKQVPFSYNPNLL